jgi:hypothetical protein
MSMTKTKNEHDEDEEEKQLKDISGSIYFTGFVTKAGKMVN